MTQTTTSQAVEQVPAPRQDFGTSTPAQRHAIEATLRAACGSPSAAEARRAQEVAGAYAAGWRSGNREALGENYWRAIDLADHFAVEYAWAVYAHDTGASPSRPPYGPAWETAARLNGLTF